jgi:hypothetical protein
MGGEVRGGKMKAREQIIEKIKKLEDERTKEYERQYPDAETAGDISTKIATLYWVLGE